MRHCLQRSNSSILFYALCSSATSVKFLISPFVRGGHFTSALSTKTIPRLKDFERVHPSSSLFARTGHNRSRHNIGYCLFTSLAHRSVTYSRGDENSPLSPRHSYTALFAKGKESIPSSKKRRSSSDSTLNHSEESERTKKATKTRSIGATTEAKSKSSSTSEVNEENVKTNKSTKSKNKIVKANTKSVTASSTTKMSTSKESITKTSGVKGAQKGGKNHNPDVTHAPSSLFPPELEPTRTKLLTPTVTLPRDKDRDDISNPCIVYWMLRDVRTGDNWALLFAQSLAMQNKVPLRVIYALPPPPDKDPEDGEDGSPPNPADMSMTERHGVFLLDGLKVVAEELQQANVSFRVLCPQSRGEVGNCVNEYCTLSEHEALAVVCDMAPLRYPRQWVEKQGAPLLEKSGIPLYQVDAHNIVPVWIASPKREVGARTLRPKIHNVFGDYCTEFPEFVGNAHLKGKLDGNKSHDHDWDRYKSFMKLDQTIQPVKGMTAGHKPAMERFHEFCSSTQQGLKNFDTHRNDPNLPYVCTNLSPWINHGQISFQRLALEVRALKKHPNGTAAYIEEGVVRRELSDNFVYYCPDGYDNLSGAADWARESLELHSSDERENLYDWRELEKAKTHDDLWNAAQLQLVTEGGMHGFMRMYWAKKVLEWTASPAYALATAQYFNDRYAYDGNDPNGFVGVGWSIMGIHDMGWKERPIFGKIRYMNYAGCKRKFKIEPFVKRYKGAAENAARALAKQGKGGNVAGKKRKAT
ncbi:hypothetical protein ACHAXS_008791 [Conticribra weissflogii]